MSKSMVKCQRCGIIFNKEEAIAEFNSQCFCGTYEDIPQMSGKWSYRNVCVECAFKLADPYMQNYGNDTFTGPHYEPYDPFTD